MLNDLLMIKLGSQLLSESILGLIYFDNIQNEFKCILSQRTKKKKKSMEFNLNVIIIGLYINM